MSLERFSKMSAGAAVIFSALVSFQAHADTLRGVVQHTIKTNPDIMVAAKIKHATNQEVKQARAGYYPKLDLHAGFGREHTENSNTRFIRHSHDGLSLWRHDVGLTLRQNLFRGWMDYYEVKRTKAKTDADSWAVCGTSQDVAMETTEAYLNVLRERRKISVGQDNLSQHQRMYNMIGERSRSGVGRQADIAQATGRLALAKSNLYAIQNDCNNAKVYYFKVTGLEARSLQMPRDPSNHILPKSRASAIYQALKYHPKMRLAVVDVEERRAQHSVSHFTAFPQLDLVLEAADGRNFNGSRALSDHYFAGFQLHYNLFNGGYDVARQRETAYLTQEAAEIRNRTCREVTEKVSLAWNNVQTARIRLSQLETHKVAAAKTKVAYEEQFKLGKRTLFDLLDSQNEEFTSNLAYVNGVYEVYVMEYRLLHAMGKLVEYLGVDTPVAAHPQYSVYDHTANPVNAKRHFDARIWAADKPSVWYNQECIEAEDFANCIECSKPTHPCYRKKDVCQPSSNLICGKNKCAPCAKPKVACAKPTCAQPKSCIKGCRVTTQGAGHGHRRGYRRVAQANTPAANRASFAQRNTGRKFKFAAANAQGRHWNGKPWNFQTNQPKSVKNIANAKTAKTKRSTNQSKQFKQAANFQHRKPVRLASANTSISNATQRIATDSEANHFTNQATSAHQRATQTANTAKTAANAEFAPRAQRATQQQQTAAPRATNAPSDEFTARANTQNANANRAAAHTGATNQANSNANAAANQNNFDQRRPARNTATDNDQPRRWKQQSHNEMKLHHNRSDLRAHERKIVNQLANKHHHAQKNIAQNAAKHQQSVNRIHARAQHQSTHHQNVKSFEPTVTGWAVDVGRFHDTAEINEVVSTLKNSGFNGFFKEIRTPTSLTYELFVGPAKNKAQAINMVAKLKGLNIQGKIVRTDHTA